MDFIIAQRFPDILPFEGKERKIIVCGQSFFHRTYAQSKKVVTVARSVIRECVELCMAGEM